MAGIVKGPEEIILKLLDGTEKKLASIRTEVTITFRNFPDKITCWYAEEVKFIAKCESTGQSSYIREVVAYGKATNPKP